MSTENLCEGSQSKISVQALNKRSLGKIAALFTKSLYKISRRGLLARSLIPIRALLGKIPVKGLLARSLNKISIRGLLARSLYKLPIHVLLARFLCELSRLARACAIDMHMDMSCHKSHFTREFTGKTLRPRSYFVWACAVEMHMAMHGNAHDVTRAILCRKITGKMPDAPEATPVLREPAQSKCTRVKNHVMRKNSRKMPDAPAAIPVLCEPSHSTCTWVKRCQKHSKAILCGKFQGKMLDG